MAGFAASRIAVGVGVPPFFRSPSSRHTKSVPRPYGLGIPTGQHIVLDNASGCSRRRSRGWVMLKRRLAKRHIDQAELGKWFRVQGSGFRVQGSGFRVQGIGFMFDGLGCKVEGIGFRIQAPQIEGLTPTRGIAVSKELESYHQLPRKSRPKRVKHMGRRAAHRVINVTLYRWIAMRITSCRSSDPRSSTKTFARTCGGVATKLAGVASTA